MNINQITPSTVLSRNTEKFLISQIGNETVLMNVDNGDYVAINETGSIIWRKIENPVRVQTVIDELVAEFDVSAERCQSETLSCLQTMLSQDMVSIHTD